MQDFNIEPRHIAAGIGSFIGAGLHFVRTVLALEAITLRAAAVGTVVFFFQVFAGFAGAMYFGPVIAHTNFRALIDPNAAIFGVGLTFYQILPLLLRLAEKFVEAVINKVGG